MYCRMIPHKVVFYDIIEEKPMSKRSKVALLVPHKTIAIGVVGGEIGEGNIWWAEHRKLLPSSGKYDMLHELGSSKPLIDPLPPSGFFWMFLCRAFAATLFRKAFFL